MLCSAGGREALNRKVLPLGSTEWVGMKAFDAPLPRSRDELQAAPPSLHTVVELLCDLRDLLGECVVRLSDLEARAAAAEERDPS
jgi:hypothetical protein